MPEFAAAPTGDNPSGLKAAWQRRVRDVIVLQLRQGVTARKIALTIAMGLMIGLFPILGTTTLLCLLAGLWLKFNQPILQLVNWSASPLQIPAIYFFIRTGEWLTHTPPLRFSITALLHQFRVAPLKFLQQFGATGLRGILAWLLIAPPLAAILYLLLLPPLRRLAQISLTGDPNVG